MCGLTRGTHEKAWSSAVRKKGSGAAEGERGDVGSDERERERGCDEKWI
jgi:hypothetical protein